MTKSNETTAPAWNLIEADYRAGAKTLRLIAGEHGITEGAIRKRAGKEQWARDLGAKIRAQADAIVRKDAVRREVRKNECVPEKEIIDSNAAQQVSIRREQKTDIRRMRKIVVEFLAALEDDLLVKDEKKKLTLQMRVQIMQKVVETHKTVVSMEREHFGITSRFGDDEDTPAQQYDTVETARRVAFLLASAMNKGA